MLWNHLPCDKFRYKINWNMRYIQTHTFCALRWDFNLSKGQQWLDIMCLMSHPKRPPKKPFTPFYNNRTLYLSSQFYRMVFFYYLSLVECSCTFCKSVYTSSQMMINIVVVFISSKPIDDRSVYNLLNKYNRKITWFIIFVQWLNSWYYQTHINGCLAPQSFNGNDSIDEKKFSDKQKTRTW